MAQQKTVFDALRDDHEIQRKLVDRLTDTEGDSADRDELFTELKVEMAAHADAEERFFYVPLMEFDLTQDKARHSVAEHHELEELIEDLEGKDRSSPGWLTTAKQLHHDLTHHLDEEEHEVFQMAGKALTETAKNDLAASYRGEMNRQRGQHR